jgi:hypothetical protein
MKYLQILFLIGLISNSFISNAQIENIRVEKYYISDDFDALDTTGGHLPSGSTTYRIYVDLPQGSKLLKVYGDANHPFSIKSTKPFFNNKNDGQSFGKDFTKNRFGLNTVALDSWLTLGQIGKTQSGVTYFGVSKDSDTSGSIIGGKNNDGGSASLPFGLLNNTNAEAGIPLFVADGMEISNVIPSGWGDYGIKDFLTSEDTTIFGSLKTGNEFVSTIFYLGNSGTVGVDTIQNNILIAQLTTEGELTFSLNLEVLEMINGVPTKVQYVSDDKILLKDNSHNEKYSGFLTYPLVCGCMNPDFTEYNPKVVCAEVGACKTQVVLGCTDPKACNYDPTANKMVHSLCCYPGSCNNRDIAQVCPSLMEDAKTVEIHPNPANDILFLSIRSGNENEIAYEIYDVFGQRLLEKNYGKNSVISDDQINIQDLHNGVYHIRIKIGETLESRTFIKN